MMKISDAGAQKRYDDEFRRVTPRLNPFMKRICSQTLEIIKNDKKKKTLKVKSKETGEEHDMTYEVFTVYLRNILPSVPVKAAEDKKLTEQ